MIYKYDLINISLKQLNQFTITFMSNNNTMLKCLHGSMYC